MARAVARAPSGSDCLDLLDDAVEASALGEEARQAKLQSDNPALTRSDVGVAHDAGFKLQIVQTMFDHVADADDPGELAVMDNRHVARAVPGHQVHHVRNGFGRGYGDHAMSHDFAHGHRCGRLAVAGNRKNDFTFRNETKNCVIARYHESADTMLGRSFDQRAFYIRYSPAEAWQKTYSGNQYRTEAQGKLMNVRRRRRYSRTST